MFLTSAQAKVFIRWKGNADIVGNLSRLGGTIAYNSKVEINGAEGKISVIDFNDKLDNTTSEIKRILNITNQDKTPNESQPTTSVYILHGKSRTTRLILIRFPLRHKLTAISIEQSNAEYKKSTSPISKHRLKAIQPFPGSTPLFSAKDKKTKLQIEVSSAATTDTAVAGFYADNLKAAGWHPYLADKHGSISKLAIYQRGQELCYILATPNANRTEQTIAIIYKKLN